MESLDLGYLPGVYQLVKVITEENGSWVDQKARGGMFTLTADQKLSVVNGPDANQCISYLGTFTVLENQLKIKVQICNMPEIEGSEISRTILFLDSECMILEAPGVRTGRRSRLTWKKIAYLQPA